MSTLALLFVLVFGASLDVSAYQRGRGRDRGHERGRDWGRSHNRGRHLGWERGRRVGQRRRDGTLFRRVLRRDRRDDRRRRRSSWNNDRNWQGSRFGRERADYRTRRFVQYRSRF
ncbi:MAG TPA: hypothetical protein VKB12_02550 [Pyrinomonadaceae bacterium]|nr:hypothetical protein [Pyrinomonadaceae bacterium]